MKNFKSILKNQKGMSLVEVMVAAAVSIVISMGIVKINETGQKAITKVSTDIDLNIWTTGVLHKELGNEGTCTENFKGVNVSSVNTTIGDSKVIFKGERTEDYPLVTNLLDGNGGRAKVPLIQDGMTIGNGDTWEITDARLLRFTSDSTTVKGVCELRVTLDRKRKASGSSDKTIITKLDCTVDKLSAPQLITKCVFAGAEANPSLWFEANSGGTDYIYRDSPVAIGSSYDFDPTPTREALLAGLTIRGPSAGVEYPISSTSGEFLGLDLRNSMISFTNSNGKNPAIFRYSSQCFKFGNGGSSITNNNEICPEFGNAVFGSANSRIDNMGPSDSESNFSAILGGSGVRINAASAMASGNNIDVTGRHGVAIGSFIDSTTSESFTIGNGSPGRNIESFGNATFTSVFQNGYRFQTAVSDGSPEERTYLIENSVYIDAGGNMQIGRKSLGAYAAAAFLPTTPKLFVNGDTSIDGDVSAQAYYVTSDRRLKKNIKKIDSALDKVMKLNGVFFEWKSNSELEMGFIAQDVEKVLPMLVKTNQRGQKSVKYSNITAVVVESIKELKAENDKLKSKVDILMELFCNKSPEEKVCE